MPLRAVIFDFDGVLADTEPLHLGAYQDVLAESGITLTRAAYYDRYLGFDDEGVFRTVAAEFGTGWSDAEIRALVATKAQRLAAAIGGRDLLLPGAATLVREVAEAMPVAIASGALRQEIEVVLAGAGLRACFQAIVAAGDVARGKPAPDPYARALELLAARLASPDAVSLGRGVVAIEDSHWGIESAKGAGLRCVAVAHTYPAHELSGADLVVSELGRLTLDVLRDLCDKE